MDVVLAFLQDSAGPAWLTALATCGLVWGVWVARKQLVEARDTREEQTRPQVVATPVYGPWNGQHLVLAIRNYGPTIAREVEVEIVETTLSNGTLSPRWVLWFREEGGGSSLAKLPLPSRTLAPGQEVRVVLLNPCSPDENGHRWLALQISCRDWKGRAVPGEPYEVSHGYYPSELVRDPVATAVESLVDDYFKHKHRGEALDSLSSTPPRNWFGWRRHGRRSWWD